MVLEECTVSKCFTLQPSKTGTLRLEISSKSQQLIESNSTRVDEGRKSLIILAIKVKARTVVGTGDGGLGGYVTPDLSYYWEGATEQCKDNKWDGEKKNGMRESVS